MTPADTAMERVRLKEIAAATGFSANTVSLALRARLVVRRST